MKIAVIAAVIENPGEAQHRFNEEISRFSGLVKGRMGLPFPEERLGVVAITVAGTLDQINHLTGRLGNLPGVSVKTAISHKSIGGVE